MADYDSLKVVSFPPTDTSGALDTLIEMYRKGEVKEVIIYTPAASDKGIYHFYASAGIRLTDVLLAKQRLVTLAHRLCEE